MTYLPAFDFSKAALFVSDMDSTLINIECIDEIADFAHLTHKVQKALCLLVKSMHSL
jgi:phosphoserine phosphatase